MSMMFSALAMAFLAMHQSSSTRLNLFNITGAANKMDSADPRMIAEDLSSPYLLLEEQADLEQGVAAAEDQGREVTF